MPINDTSMPVFTEEIKVMTNRDTKKVEDVTVEYYVYSDDLQFNYTIVRCIPFIDDNQICIIYEKGDHSSFPGGRVESGETPFQGIKREVLEELNAEVLKATPYCVIRYLWKKDGTSDYILIYKCLVQLNEGAIKDPDGESIRREIIDFKSIPEKFENEKWVLNIIDILNKYPGL